jgi:hypothetical protein
MSSNFKKIAFYSGFGIDVIALLIGLYLLVADNMNFSSSDNTGLAVITVLFAGWIGLCWYLKSKGSPGVAAVLAWLPAAPLFLYGLMVLLFVILKPDMR